MSFLQTRRGELKRQRKREVPAVECPFLFPLLVKARGVGLVWNVGPYPVDVLSS